MGKTTNQQTDGMSYDNSSSSHQAPKKSYEEDEEKKRVFFSVFEWPKCTFLDSFLFSPAFLNSSPSLTLFDEADRRL